MKTSTKLLSMFSAFCAFLLFGLTANAQSITVAGGLTANQVAQALVGSNVTVTNATLTGAASASGSFSQGTSTFPLSDGIILTSGSINNALGPNNSTGASASNGTPGDIDLGALVPGLTTYDACVLEFDVTSNCNTLTFDYIFASEEYPEYGCSNFNDAFGFLISGPGFTPNTNIALVPGTTTPVSINNVINSPATGCVSNPAYYVDNAAGLGVQYDGYTVVMTATAIIQPCQTYHVKIVVGDAGDSALDSAIFLKGGGINCSSPSIATANITPVDCGVLGTIDLDLGTATGPFTYSWTGPNGFTATTEDLTGLVAGDYIVDFVGADCLSSGQSTFTVTENIDATAPVFANCPSDITVESPNPLCAFTLNWPTPPTATDNCGVTTFDVSHDQTHEFGNGTTVVTYTATDAAGNVSTCSFNVTINAAPLEVELVPFEYNGGVHIRCFGEFNGSLYAAADGGCYPYTYSWIHPVNGPQSVVVSAPTQVPVSGLPAGPFAMTVVDGNLTSVTEIITLIENPPVQAVVTTTPILCNGGSSTVTVNGISGTAPYSTSTFNNIFPGTYNYLVADANGCRDGEIVTITEPGLLEATSTSTPILCYGDTAEITIAATGGTMPYFGTGLVEEVVGTYTYTVTDANGCSDVTTISLNQPGQLTAMVSSTPILCYGGTSTVITEVVSGVEPYTGVDTLIEYAGHHTYVVYDYNSCSDTVSVTITEPTPLVASATATTIACVGETATITVSATGGTPMYTGGYTGEGTFTVSAAGTYTYTVTDMNGCTADVTVTVTEDIDVTAPVFADCPSDIIVDSPNPLCEFALNWPTPPIATDDCGVTSFTASHDTTYQFGNGTTVVTYTATDAAGNVSTCSFNVTINAAPLEVELVPFEYNGGVHIRCFGQSNGSLYAAAEGGCYPYTYSWVHPVNGAQTVVVSAPTQVPVSGLPAGPFAMTVVDGNLTSVTEIITLIENPPIQAVVSTTPILCNGGSSTVTVSGVSGTAPYVTSTFTDVSAGTYNYLIADANGCRDGELVTITEPNLLEATSISTPILCYGGTSQVTVAATGGTMPYTGVGVMDEVIGTYDYTVIDANGCSDLTSISINQPGQMVASVSATPILCYGETCLVTVGVVSGTEPYAGFGTFVEYAGTHTYVVTDYNMCTDTVSISVTQPSMMTSTITATPILCNGDSSVVTVTGAGGTGSWNGTGTFTVAAGTHTYPFTDANGCMDTASITVIEPTPLVASATATTIACAGGTADITVSATGGMPMYTGGYTGEGTFTVTAGTYTYTVTDMNGCTSDVTITVTEPTPLVASATATTISCAGGTADITVSATGGIPMYTGGYTGEGTFTVTAGTYTYTVTDMNGCTSDVTITVTESAPLVASATATTIACNGGTADITVSATGGMPMYTGGYTGEGTFTVTAGTYTYTVTDMNGCTSDVTITVTEPAVMTAFASCPAILCNGGTTDMGVTAFGGTAPYTGGGVFNVGAGTYTYTITDANGCTATTTHVVTEPAAINVTISSTGIDCNGGTADVTVTATGGTGSLTGTGTFNVGPGTYDYTVTDANGCTVTETITVTEPTVLVASSSATSILCNGESADVTVTATGGTAPYTGVGTFSETAGTYTYTVTDANGCTSSTTVTLTEPTVMTAFASCPSILCNGGTTDMGVTAFGGTAPYTGGGVFSVGAGTYTYTLTDANGCTATTTHVVTEPAAINVTVSSTGIDCNGGTADVTVTATGGTGSLTGTGNFNVGSGTYDYTVTDVNGCTATETITLVEPAVLVASSSTAGILCNGGSADVVVTATGGTAPYTGAGTFSETAGTYTYTVTDANGCTSSTTVTLTEPTLMTAYASCPVIDCNGGTADMAVFAFGGTPPYSGTGVFNVSAGTYTYTITDANGCTATVTHTVTEPAAINVTVSSTGIDCNGGTADVSVTAAGGTAPYTGTGTFSETAGTYTYTVTDANGCTATETITVAEPASIVVSATCPSAILCNGGSTDVIVTATGGSAPYTGTGTFSQAAGTVTYTVTDANGCTGTKTVTLAEPTLMTAYASCPAPLLCNGGTADLAVTAFGGTAPYTGTGIFSVGAGTYTYTITDANGCTATVTHTVTEPAAINVTVSSTGIDCNGGTADVSVTATGGTAPYTGTGTFSETAGTYTYTVTDANGCTATKTITLAEPASIVVSATCPSAILCNGGSTDVIVVATGGSAPYTGTGTFSQSAGTVIYTVTDANGCTSSTTVTLGEPAALVASTSASSILCNGGTADVTVTATGGTAPYTITGVGTGSNSAPFTSLGQALGAPSAGMYFFNLGGTTFETYVDANGYVQIARDYGSGTGNLPQATSLTTSTRGILSPSVLSTLSSATEVRISSSTGNVDVTTTNSGIISKLANNETLHRGSIDNAVNNSWTGTNASWFTANASCNTSSGNTLNENIFHGCGNVGLFHWVQSTGTQRERWSNGEVASGVSFSLWVKGGASNASVVFNELAGTHTYSVIDANGCTASVTHTLVEPSALVATATVGSFDCATNTAGVTISATGGTVPYTGTGVMAQANGSTTYTVTDANGCTTTVSATVVAVSSVSLACPGDQTFDCTSAITGGQTVTWTEPTASSVSPCNTGCGPNTAIAGFIYLGEQNGSRYYCSNTSSFSWQAANTAANAAGGHLVSIESSVENDFVKNLIGASVVWIGFNDENVEGTFEWANGESVGYTNWASTDPDNSGPLYGASSCGEADYTVLRQTDGQWLDRFECNLNEFVMEVPCGSSSNSITVTQISGPANGSFVNGGTTEVVTYVATDNTTGASDTCSFTLTVDGAATISLACPGDQTFPCTNSGLGGEMVSWNEPTATSSCNTGCGPNTAITGFNYMGEFNGHRYYVMTSPSYSWQAANIAAINAGGHLASIESAAENTFIHNNMGVSSAWIGFNDQSVEGTFEWINGEPVTYVNWDAGEADNSGPTYGVTNCGEADYSVIRLATGKWADRFECNLNEFIMEVPCNGSITVSQISGPTNGSLVTAGTIEVVTYVATDNTTGATDTCSFTLTVDGATSVSLICPGDQTFPCTNSGNGGETVTWIEPTASAFSACNTGCGPVTQVSGYIYMGEFGGSRYYCSNTSNFSWQAANAAAISAGGHLVTIESSAENQFVKNAIGASVVWIGFTDQNVEGTFEWANGQNVNYTNWASTDPDNSGPIQSGVTHCGEADYTVLRKNDGQWLDRFECNLNEFVLEIPCSNSITVAQISGPTNGGFVNAGTEVVTYVATHSASGATDTCSFSVTVEHCPPSYCASYAACTAYEWIDQVSIGSINNQSGNDGGYGDYTAMATGATVGDVVNLTLTPGFSGSTYTEAWRVWIDWNYDGDFDDQGEMVYQGYGTSALNGSFTVPSNALVNHDLRVRVSMQWNCYSGPCSCFQYGEVEDYTIFITGSSAMVDLDQGNLPSVIQEGQFTTTEENKDNLILSSDVSKGGSGLELRDIYPNPVLSSNGDVTIDVRTAKEGDVTVRIYDMSGKVLMEDIVYLESGPNSRKLDVTGFARGTYIIKLVSGDFQESTPLIVQ